MTRLTYDEAVARMRAWASEHGGTVHEVDWVVPGRQYRHAHAEIDVPPERLPERAAEVAALLTSIPCPGLLCVNTYSHREPSIGLGFSRDLKPEECEGLTGHREVA